MATPRITEVHVDNVNYDATNAAAGFTLDGHRYHIWFNPQTMKADDTLHKNPVKDEPKETRRSSHRALDPNATCNVPLLAEMWRQIKEGNMIAEAIRIERYEDVRNEAENENHRFDLRIKFRARAANCLPAVAMASSMQEAAIAKIIEAMEWAQSQ